MFLITEMSASQAERWARHAFQALVKTGAEIPEDVSGAGMAGLYLLGFKALGNMPPQESDMLLDELMGCVRIVRDKNHPETGMPLFEEDIDEIKTRFLLQMEAFELITGFSLAGLKQALISGQMTSSPASSPTPTLPESLAS